MHVQSIFSTPLGVETLEGDPTLTREILDSVGWDSYDGVGKSPGNDFLKDFPVLGKQILDAFNVMKGEWLGLSQTEFKISASWATRTEPEAEGPFHRHYNNMFTGVYYPLDDNYSPLQVLRTNSEPTSFYIARNQDNPFCSDSVFVVPHQHLMTVFPSYLLHRITRNRSDSLRYSIAFNFFPVGNLGEDDSSVCVVDARPIEG
jgi:uncharacterized protein (TIGR02466 family)